MWTREKCLFECIELQGTCDVVKTIVKECVVSKVDFQQILLYLVLESLGRTKREHQKYRVTLIAVR